MASVSSSTLIIFIASILVAASVAGTMTNGVQRLSDALGDRSVDVSQEIQTDVEIISDSASSSSIYDGGNLTLLVKNTGSGGLAADPSVVDVIVDGTYVTNVSLSVVDGSSWGPGNVVRVTASGVDLSSGDHRAVVIVHGDREVLEFRT
ncbi:flagellar protein G [Halobacterium litoreum]|uniref:Flagellar protein G n=1 Tax=Halobacterium litoreum TaxID=2039234 RepID=A0ABD5NA91_9EURY|nr:flagellar protein G [Halobacterium litoreum]UHH12024.1 flagellar protein G [Halobacterium litoreum]